MTPEEVKSLWSDGPLTFASKRTPILEHIDSQAEQIKRLEDALIEERARGNHYGISYEDTRGEIERWIVDGEKDVPESYLEIMRSEARQQLHAEGKIGSGHVAASRLTDEQRRAIEYGIVLMGDCGAAAVLRAMLEEAKQ